MEKDKNILKRLVVDVPEEFHKRIKVQCAKRCASMKAYVHDSIMRALLEDEKYDKENK